MDHVIDDLWIVLGQLHRLSARFAEPTIFESGSEHRGEATEEVFVDFDRDLFFTYEKGDYDDTLESKIMLWSADEAWCMHLDSLTSNAPFRSIAVLVFVRM